MQYVPPPGSFNYAPPPYTPPPALSTGAITGLIALAVLVPVIGPLIAFIAGLIHNTKKGSGWLIGCGAALGAFQLLVLLSVAIAIPNFVSIKEKSKEAEVKQNLHSIQLAVERFAVDHDGAYPTTIDELQAQSYLPQLPQNPFTNQPMRNISPGEQPFQGEFTYKPAVKDGGVVGYELYGYGSAQSKGAESAVPGMEHVIIVLKYGPDTPPDQD